MKDSYLNDKRSRVPTHNHSEYKGVTITWKRTPIPSSNYFFLSKEVSKIRSKNGPVKSTIHYKGD